MINRKKVSILTPCYNVEKYIADYLESILAQNYNSIEIILVDDGSTDNTSTIIEQYRSNFESRGISYSYVYKDNGGAASAISKGLPMVHGEYLIWPDADDILLEDSIKKRVEYMDAHHECNLLRCNGYVYNENYPHRPSGVISKRLKRTTTLTDFAKFIVPWCPGCFILRMDSFDIANPTRKIYESKCGQNIQMLIPSVTKFSCFYLDEFVYGYFIHNDSHSHKKRNYENAAQHIDDLRECFIQSLLIVNKESDKYIKTHDIFNRRIHFETAWKYGEKAEMKKYEMIMREYNEFHFEHILMKYSKPKKITFLLVRIISKVRQVLC